MAVPLLPQQPAPVTRRQVALTARHLRPIQGQLSALLLALRRETDAALGPRLRPVSGKSYPLGRCQPITEDVVARFRGRLARVDGPVERAIRRFLAEGGVIRPIWGALRGLYFQNALQVGGLYVDVANDTVTVTKPKIEILPLPESGFEAIRGPEHFAEIAERYWGARVFANHALPALAPILPIVSVVPGGEARLQSASDYMIDLFRRDGFALSEAWLAGGPVPPPEIVAELEARGRQVLGSGPVATGAAAAVAACRQARAAEVHRDEGWRDARVMDYLRLHASGQPAAPPPR
ncbi:hypothetical protein SAMN06265365_101462 [Tistlia consotensis]|uniref:Uncharacterized protein n=1 Tax=Tistlia consotensis USBA 355 TaxID=560819 RepID=A0A1Y6B776_9PROT|nr:hypothetical protein [Tistlia consotensis]SME92051.1 hypothetical protein SAMN05428998_101460 [Tistlia consotensis USBA 355]SNR27771.1 hypothetical protein SAMN06265365_101462 [Tistlia consotensis]